MRDYLAAIETWRRSSGIDRVGARRRALDLAQRYDRPVSRYAFIAPPPGGRCRPTMRVDVESRNFHAVVANVEDRWEVRVSHARTGYLVASSGGYAHSLYRVTLLTGQSEREALEERTLMAINKLEAVKLPWESADPDAIVKASERGKTKSGKTRLIGGLRDALKAIRSIVR